MSHRLPILGQVETAAKQYVSPGTLYDQLTYPETGSSSKVSKDELLSVLCRVDLAYLAQDDAALVDDIDWEERLSLGEKQRLAMARLIYHKPSFAILDECTSAVSGHMSHGAPPRPVLPILGLTYPLGAMQAMDYRLLQTTGRRLWAAGYRLQARTTIWAAGSGYGLQATRYGLQVASYRLSTAVESHRKASF